MTGLATDTDFGPVCSVTAINRVEVFAHIGAVAFDTAAVRILEVARPVKRMFGIEIFIGLQVIPTLPALLYSPAVPGQIQGLQVAPANINQILLQGIVPECVLDREQAGFTVRTGGRYLEFTALAEQARVDTVKVNSYIVKITQHGIFIGELHRLVVIRLLPVKVYFLMALGAACGTGKFCRLFCCLD